MFSTPPLYRLHEIVFLYVLIGGLCFSSIQSKAGRGVLRVDEIALQLNLPTLKLRRDIFLHMIVNIMIDCTEFLEMVDFRTPSGTRNTELFARQHHRTAYEMNSPVICKQRKANLLPSYIKFFHSALPTIRKSLLAARKECVLVLARCHGFC
ncbi:hypothetical protein J6590_084433 [Homalodisca vitripennis]|nr:hypothetical protein J6590_084433 [Homalodisca vitripennis]